MKRVAPASKGALKAKKTRPEVPEYHLTPSMRDEDGDIIWPAPKDRMEAARAFIRECAEANMNTLIVPDKDADGLTSGVILYRTLVLLGLSPNLILVHLLSKGNDVHSEVERQRMTHVEPSYIFVLDQGSRQAPPLIDIPHKALVIDHHYATASDFPSGAQFVSACSSPPVATSSLLTYTLCTPLHSGVEAQCDWLCAMGTHGDLGNTLKWQPPFPCMRDTFKRYTKKTINDAVGIINAPRRAAAFDVTSAWSALLDASAPAELLRNKSLNAAREEVALEVERCTHTAPKFSVDGKVAVFRISSAAQVHPVIATRWAGHLNSKKLEIVLVANSGYVPDKVNFSCRIARCARAREIPVNIIESLKSFAAMSESGTLAERLGGSFARGHKEASGGIVGVDEFEELMTCLRVGQKPEKSEGDNVSPRKKKVLGQKNTLMSYFGKKAEG